MGGVSLSLGRRQRYNTPGGPEVVNCPRQGVVLDAVEGALPKRYSHSNDLDFEKRPSASRTWWTLSNSYSCRTSRLGAAPHVKALRAQSLCKLSIYATLGLKKKWTKKRGRTGWLISVIYEHVALQARRDSSKPPRAYATSRGWEPPPKTESHHFGLQLRLQLLLCFRSLSCRATRLGERPAR